MLKTRKFRYTKKKFAEIIIVLIMAYVSELTIPGQASMQKFVWCVIACLGGIALLLRNRIIKDFSNIIIWYCIPFFLASVYSVMLKILGTDELGTMQHAISTTLFIVVDFLMVIGLIYYFKNRTVNIGMEVIIICYVFTIILTIKNLGISVFFTEIKSMNVNFLEKHDIGVAVVPFLLMHIYKWLFVKEKNKKLLSVPFVTLVCILALCGKRSAILSIVVALGVMSVIKASKNKRILIAHMCSLITFLSCYVYIALIKIEKFDFLLDIQGDSSVRDRYIVWKFFANEYSISPFYFGKGFQYIHHFMRNGLGIQLVNDYDYLHNSILQIFIELGFMGFVIWFFVILFIIPREARMRCGINTYFFTTISMIAMVAMFTVDNTLTYPVYLISVFISIYGIYLTEKLGEKKDAASKCGCTNI